MYTWATFTTYLKMIEIVEVFSGGNLKHMGLRGKVDSTVKMGKTFLYVFIEVFFRQGHQGLILLTACRLVR